MLIGTRGRLAVTLAAAALLGLVAGCEGEKNKADTAADAGAQDAGPQQPVVGGKLGAALASAASVSAAPPPAGSAAGPPEAGVFAPGASAAALPKGTPYKIEVISDGAEPRAKLAAALDPKAEQKVTFTVGLRMGGPQAMPNLDIEMAFKIDKPKKDKPKPGEAEPAPLAGTAVTGKVVAATLAAMGLGGPPKEITDELAKLKGSLLRYQIGPANTASDLRFELAKGADPGLDAVLKAVGEAITLLAPALPDKPVGVGAYWMVTDRSVWPGAQIPMLRYRIFKVEKIDGAAVTFSLETRQYAEEGVAKIPSGGQEVTLSVDQLDSTGKGTVAWEPSLLVSRDADLVQRVQARLVPPGAQGAAQRMMIQAELNAKLRPPAPPPPP